MRTNRLKILFLTVLAISTISLSSCWDEVHPGTYYTFEGKTVASDLVDNPNYSYFVRVLERTGLLNDLSTYGHYTCFAPDNHAVEQFLQEREEMAKKIARKEGKSEDISYLTVDDLPIEDCDTLAWTHLIDITCFLGDLDPGLLPKVNLNDRYLYLILDSTKEEQLGDSVIALQRRLNNAIVVAKDDSCENGVVHYIDRCIDFSGDYVYDLVDHDPKTTLFSEALKLCGFHSILSEYYDPNYKIGYDSVHKGVALTSAGNNYTVFYWEKRKTCFTLLVPTDSVFAANSILSVEDMFNKAKQVYPDFNDNDSIMANFHDPRNPLNKFIAYHILPFLTDLSRINGRSDIIKKYNAKKTDPEDYFEPLLSKSLMRISTVYKNGQIGSTYINRRDNEGNGTTGFKGGKVPGVRIVPTTEMNVSKFEALNGVYYYIDGILTYDVDKTREDILDRRIRIDCTTLSPDFLTSGRRQFDASNTGVSKYGSGFKDPKNFVSYHSDYTLSVRAPNTSSSYAYEGDGIDIEGQFDIYVKLPPVPHDGTWQLRLSFRSNRLCGIVQNYIAALPVGQEVQRTDWKPMGLPVDLRVNMEDPAVGWIEDSELDGPAAIEALDKSMKNRGWLKGSDAQQTATDIIHRDVNTMGRLILSTEYMTSNTDYYIRIKQLLDDSKAEFLFDFIELVPKSVYDMNEDKH